MFVVKIISMLISSPIEGLIESHTYYSYYNILCLIVLLLLITLLLGRQKIQKMVVYCTYEIRWEVSDLTT